ncbi:hypothetical protein HY497_02455 [Candidatus Woesearchaeota archaeon]|nr:hypothetical protein [Candidatus Woesearchaeota archaeon]
MTETIAILVIFFIIVLFGFMFYAQFQRSSYDENKVILAGEKAVSISLHALLLPELRCSKGDNVPIKDCLDLSKLDISVQKMAEERDYYFDIMGFARVSVQQYYPTEQAWVLYDHPLENAPRVPQMNIPIALFDPITKTFRYGVLTVAVYT